MNAATAAADNDDTTKTMSIDDAMWNGMHADNSSSKKQKKENGPKKAN